ncbi:GNAT family N-acetyltransferase [Agromyces aerolatus]|uniref:GNAT family N-acetyltransferase n=1 Tax=Agromyces sp. LY-1074 TaxID=3074080 RepID=UPI00285F18C1|nr:MULTISPECIES: GNAT family N-acetyltransferase [unclassified Agromyces]MDR5701773.1 GNAT family N-acetyltransferase [Agromyces sp. LY-1074]MDR5708040.1 GNAT family N-acetyltransferase [Agromyces sp. LY-1358]
MANGNDDDTAPALRIVPATRTSLADLESVFGTRGDAAHCWCQWFKIPARDWREIGDDEMHDRLADQLASPGPGPGLLAYDGDEPVGWCAIEPRPALTRLRRSRIVKLGSERTDLDDEGVWALSCFVVPPRHRGRGVATELARAAVDFAAEHGARTVEAYAVDVAARARTSAAELYHGTVSMFAAAGFTEVARPTPGRVVMQRVLP